MVASVDRPLEAEIAQGWVIVRTPPEGPVVLTLLFGDLQVVDAGYSPLHQAVGIELPVLVAVTTVKEIRRKASKIAPAYNKGALQYLPDEKDG